MQLIVTLKIRGFCSIKSFAAKIIETNFIKNNYKIRYKLLHSPIINSAIKRSKFKGVNKHRVSYSNLEGKR